MATFVEKHYLEALVKYFNGLTDYEYKGIKSPNWTLTNTEWVAKDVAGTVQAHLVIYGRRPAITEKLFAEPGFEDGYLEGLAAYFNSLGDYVYTFEDGTVVVPGEYTAAIAKDIAEEVSGSVEKHFLLYARRPAILNKVDEKADPASGETFTLTVGEDNFVGTNGNDTFKAPIVQDNIGTPVNTLESFDTLDGAGGVNTLNATINANAAPVISNIQIFNIRNVTADATLDLIDVTDVEQIWNAASGSARTLTFDNAPIAATFGVRNTASITDIDNFDDVTGDADILNLMLVNAGKEALAAVVDSSTDAGNIEGLDVTASGTNYVDLSAFNAAETLEVETSGAMELEVDGTAMTDITISGSGELELTDPTTVFGVIETLDATGFSGDLDIDISGGAIADLSVETGDGNDRVVINGDILVAANDDIVIDLGDGENTLGLTNIDDDVAIGTLVFDAATISGVNTVELIDAIVLGADATIDFDGITPPSDLIFGGAVNGDTHTLSLDNTATSLTTTFEGAVGVAAETFEVDFLTAEELTLNVEADVLGTTLVGDELTSLVVNVTENATEFGDDTNATDIVTIEGQGDADLDTLTSVTLNDTSEDGDAQFMVDLTNTTMVDTINLSGGEATDFTLDVSAAAFDGSVTINIGDFGVDADGTVLGALDYATDVDNGVREYFVFTGEDIADVDIAGFHKAVLGGTGDRLDFRQFEGITSDDQLDITLTALGDTVITALNDEFNGTITITGVDLTDDPAYFIF